MSLPEFKQLVDEAKSQIGEISPDDLRRMQQSGEDFTLIDVRERDEQSKGIIPGAISLPRGILEVNIDQITIDKDRKLVLYCGAGRLPLSISRRWDFARLSHWWISRLA
jgi:hypothetical protein